MLRLIVSRVDRNPEIPSFPEELAKPIFDEPFSSNIYQKGPFLFVMSAQDPSHCLSCDLTLEVETNNAEDASRMVICHFSEISSQKVKYFIDNDDTLFHIIMTQFQMKILEQLLLFCATHSAKKLRIYTDGATSEDLKVYYDFLASGNDSFIHNNNTEMIISIKQDTYTDWSTYMNQVFLKFRQTLWQGQRTSQAIKNYLKAHPLG